MRALVFKKTLTFCTDYPAPVPSAGEALVRVAYAGVCATDLEIIKGYMGFGGVPGHEFTGIVEEAGDSSLIGKRVTGSINIGCGDCSFCEAGIENHCPHRRVLGILNKDGAFGDYITLPARNLYLLPDNLSLEEGIFVEPLGAAYEITSQVRVEKNMRVAVLGDGRLGLLCALVLGERGCSLTLVGRDEERLMYMEGMGMAVRTGTEGLGRGFDLTVDCTGTAEGLGEAIAITRPRGTVVLKTTVAKRPSSDDLSRVVIDEITIVGSRCGPFGPAISALSEGRIDVRPFISAIYPIKDGLDAVREAGRPGVLKVLISMEEGEKR